MAVVMADERKEHTFLWFIENFCYSWHKNRELLASPVFIADELEGTSWNLQMYPRGENDFCKNRISLSLHRSANDNGPEDYQLNFEVSLVSTNGSALCSDEYDYEFERNSDDGTTDLVMVEEVLCRRKAEYLPRNTLSVRCKMWTGEGEVRKASHTCARTRIGVENISFMHVVENLIAFETITVHARSHSKKECFVSSRLYWTDGLCCEKKLVVEIKPSDASYALHEFKISLLARSGNKVDCCPSVGRLDGTRKDIYIFTLTLSLKEILKNSQDYLAGGRLSLLCECTFSTGIEFNELESTMTGNYGQDKRMNYAAEKLFECAGAMGDLKGIYNNQFLTDMEIKTVTKSFPAHKIVLCARSSVFKTMMTNDMKEKIANCIQIDDLEDDVVQKLLLFLYSDNLEDMEWEDAIKVYYAADKYQIEKLKLTCSSFLVDNLNASNASELLILADTHKDSDLKKTVQEFILKHEDEVFGSDEWQTQMEENYLLFVKTMLLKYKKKQVNSK